MNILLIYATYSGSTEEAAKVASAELTKAGHKVTMKTPAQVTSEECTSADALVLASPSWDFAEKEGQPHEDFETFFKNLGGTQLAGKPYAVLGLGDTAYQHFNGAVGVIEEFMNGRGATKAKDSLKIDKYFTLPDNPQKVTAWASGLFNT
jgi:flavodoxin I